MRIAIVGSGVSGLMAAAELVGEHDVTVFEGADYYGGHTNTIEVEDRRGRIAVDTGFIVFNDRTYPQFIRMLDRLGIASQPTSMGFSVRCDRSGLEYAGTSANGLFAQRSNLVRPRFWGLLREWLRFSREAEAQAASDPGLTVGQFLERNRYSRDFTEYYFLPMGSAIWSCARSRFSQFPIDFILEFYRNHGLLSVTNRPTWRVVRGGSQAYVRALTAPLRDRIRLRTPVKHVRRDIEGVELQLGEARVERFEAVVFACHADQALRILGDSATPMEREILGEFPYERNTAVLHTDVSVLPRRRRAWASWNYRVGANDPGLATVTYNMNILQGLVAEEVYCVTLNDSEAINPRRVIRTIEYEHPTFSLRRKAMQTRHRELLGPNRSYFCGAYWGNGFHEDGVVSALAVCAALRTSTAAGNFSRPPDAAAFTT